MAGRDLVAPLAAAAAFAFSFVLGALTAVPAAAQPTTPSPSSASPSPAAPLPILRWLVQDMPPHFVYRDGKAPQRVEDLGQGEVDGFLRLLIERMPQFRHVFVELSLPRFEAQARQGETICSVLHVRTPERLQWLYFTSLYPPMLSRQIHVIVRREDLSRFESNGQPLQLADLLRRTDLTGLVPRDRSFGPRIDKLLTADPERAPRSVVAGRGAHLLPMLRARRMDYTLEYPITVDDFSAMHPGAPELAKLPLAEGRSTLVATAGCSRTPEGRRAIEAMDQAVRQLAADPQREAWIKAWRNGAPIDTEDLQRLNRFLDERARGPAQVE
ncbi:TIGR02285 family protein [Mitsuaria sp. GD03876]|uniref:TIGR02285 family protein n=1 Tax=Mitsuaria sp. GD03876 TaxID=2975399 RepID=UPI00244C9FAB|nr:TIGR02285 family protein [Mitsuaria sp. GD03876]MDH0867445.1 TIGR02285 family protein [Mitsuaria sp. GD03876]